MKYFWAILFCSSAFSQSFSNKIPKQDIEIYLQDLVFKEGVFSTERGGHLQSESFYLQAKHLTYVNKSSSLPSENYVKAEKECALYKDGSIFLAESCFYDFKLKKGKMDKVKTSFGLYFLEASSIIFNPDKSYDAYDVSITTCEKDPIFLIKMKHLRFFDQCKLEGSHAQIKISNVPIFWIPKWNYNLNNSSPSPVSYRLSWDAGQGPQISFRNKAFSYRDLNVFLRGDYRYKRGPAGAIEMEYHAPDGLTKFLSKNYGAYDTFYNDDNPNKKQTRFRFQTIFSKTTSNKSSGIDLIFDRMTDKNMPQDFNMDRFELKTQKKNRCDIFHHTSFYKAHALFTPRVNGYQGFNQKIPELTFHLKPLSLWNSSLLFYNNFKLSFYDYVYSNMLVYPPLYTQSLQDFHALRAETYQQLSYPCSLKFLKILPSVGLKGIVYTNSPSHETAYQGVVDYGLNTSTSLEKKYKNFNHLITPYIDYQGLLKPTLQPQNVYIFSLDDGYDKLNQVTFGLEQKFFDVKDPLLQTSINCYGLSFFGDSTFKLTVPKAGIKITSNYENLALFSHLRWNFNNQVLDIGNFSMAYTLSALASWKLEFRYRSAYDYRKCDHENYILDSTRPIEDLANSPISDRRFTLISSASLYLAPKWRCNIQMHNGWGRLAEPGYTEAKIDLTTLISSAWKLQLSYMFTTRGKSHFGLKIDLNK